MLSWTSAPAQRQLIATHKVVNTKLEIFESFIVSNYESKCRWSEISNPLDFVRVSTLRSQM